MNKTGIIYINGVAGAKVGHRPVFTYEGALEKYKLFLNVCYSNFDMASSMVLTEVENDMVALGWNREELEEIEANYLEEVFIHE